jgi:hypothetical protein
MDFVTQVKEHLCRYKKLKFPKFPNGYWTRSTPKKELCYAFTWDDRENNFLLQYNALFTQSKFWKEGKDRIKPHIYMHHMNSSQAMCINFFYPLLVEKQLDIILAFLKIENEEVDYESACFEKLSKKDSTKKRRPTNFDFYFKTMSGKEFYFEIKYTEYQFEKVKDDTDHREKFEEVYINHLASIRNKYKSRTVFLENYQIMRNLIHIEENAYVIFLYPCENRKIKEGATKAENQFVDPRYASHFFNLHWDKIFQFVKVRVNDKKLINQYEEFEEKYFPKG